MSRFGCYLTGVIPIPAFRLIFEEKFCHPFRKFTLLDLAILIPLESGQVRKIDSVGDDKLRVLPRCFSGETAANRQVLLFQVFQRVLLESG